MSADPSCLPHNSRAPYRWPVRWWSVRRTAGAHSTGPRSGRVRAVVVEAVAWCAVLTYPSTLGVTFSSSWFGYSVPLVVMSASLTVVLASLIRHRPLPALAVLLAGWFTATLSRSTLEIGLLQVVICDSALFYIAATRDRRTSLAAAAMTLAVQVAAVGFYSPGGSDAYVRTLALTGLALIVAWSTGHSSHERRLLEEAMHTQAVEQTAAQAVVAERLRIARELHDMIAHSIGVIAIQAGVGRRVIATQPAEARKALGTIEATSRDTLAGLRRTLVALRREEPEGDSAPAPDSPVPPPGEPASYAPDGRNAAGGVPGGRGAGRRRTGERRTGERRTDRGKDDSREAGGRKAGGGKAGGAVSGTGSDPVPGLAQLDRLAATTREAGVRVDVRRLGESRPLPSDVDLAAYRILQESLTNVVRHAGAGTCRVSVDQRDHARLFIEVEDDGGGGTCPGGPGSGPGTGFGLIGMRERVALLRGDFSAVPRPDGGFRVTAGLPLPVPDTTEEVR